MLRQGPSEFPTRFWDHKFGFDTVFGRKRGFYIVGMSSRKRASNYPMDHCFRIQGDVGAVGSNQIQCLPTHL